MGAVESDSVKPPRKAKDKLHKACERAQKLMSEHWIGWNKTMRMASMRFLVNTQIQSCTAAPRVWHFSAFH